MPFIADTTLYLNADRSAVVEEGSPDAAFLLVRAGAAVDDATAAQYKLTLQPAPVYDAQADHAAKHGGDTEAAARARRQRMLEGVQDPDGPPVEGERGNLEAAPDEPKAVSKAPANKAAKESK